MCPISCLATSRQTSSRVRSPPRGSSIVRSHSFLPQPCRRSTVRRRTRARSSRASCRGSPRSWSWPGSMAARTSAVLCPSRCAWGRPAQFDGTAWVSADGAHFWNGAAWQPIGRSKARRSGLVIVLAIFVAGVVLFGGYRLFQRVTTPYAGDGVSNAQMDSSTQIEFDYKRSATCHSLTFDYRFFDSKGAMVDELESQQGHEIAGGRSIHVTANTA